MSADDAYVDFPQLVVSRSDWPDSAQGQKWITTYRLESRGTLRIPERMAKQLAEQIRATRELAVLLAEAKGETE